MKIKGYVRASSIVAYLQGKEVPIFESNEICNAKGFEVEIDTSDKEIELSLIGGEQHSNLMIKRLT